MDLATVVPWGRNLTEYLTMFGLSEELLKRKRVLGVGDGPASFNCELTRIGGSVCSIDPIYKFSRDQIKKRIQDVVPVMRDQLCAHSDGYIWSSFRNVDDLVSSRLETMNTFLEDYDLGKEQDRYIDASLPDLPFSSDTFDLALCSHLLFTYDDMLDEEFHSNSLLALSDVAHEVRVFPVVNRNGVQSRFLEPLLRRITNKKLSWALEPVVYRFQRGAEVMLKIQRR